MDRRPNTISEEWQPSPTFTRGRARVEVQPRQIHRQRCLCPEACPTFTTGRHERDVTASRGCLCAAALAVDVGGRHVGGFSHRGRPGEYFTVWKDGF